MKKIAIIVVSIAIVISAALVLPSLAPESDESAYSNASLTAQGSPYDFGSISMKDGFVETTYRLINTGDESVTVGKIYTSCMCTTAFIIEGDGSEKGVFGMPGHRGVLSRADSTVASGESVDIRVVFDPAAHGPSRVGLIKRFIYIETNSAAFPKLELRFQAMVTP